ncbi:MAG: radical SAM protein [Pseudomonadota bacterium]
MKKQKSFSIISLGCPKNLVDSEVMVGIMMTSGYILDPESENADIVIINTCSFIDKAENEARNIIDEFCESKRNKQIEKLIVTGCFPQKYIDKIETMYPDVDLFCGTSNFEKISELIETQNSIKNIDNDPQYLYDHTTPRLNTLPPHTAYLKISEGCSRKCSFCIIPQLRGKLRSRTIDSICTEAQNLANIGVKELNLISQESNLYGADLKDKNQNLLELLKKLSTIDSIEWIRLFIFILILILIQNS